MDFKEERELLERCFTGDKHAYDEFVRKYTKLIYNSIYRTLELKGYKLEEDLINDLHQEVFLSLIKDDFKKLRQFKWWSNERKTSCSLATWLGVVTRNFVLNFIRSDSKYKKLTKSLDEETDEEKESLLLDTIKDDRPDFRESIEQEEMINLLNDYIEKLNPTERMILEMFYLQNLSLEEIAKAIDKSPDAVFMQKKRIIEELQDKIKKDVGFSKINRLL